MPPPTALLLAGGSGTRIRELYPDVPKPMIPVAGKPFLEWQLQYWKRQGVHRFVISLGYLADVAERYFDSRPDDGLEIHIVREQQAMGTAGAITYAAATVPLSDPFFVANADSIVFADTSDAVRYLDNPQVDAAIVGIAVPDTSRYGSLAINTENRLLGFREKQPGRGVINGGIYLFRLKLLASFPLKTPLSMETEVYPLLIAQGADIRVPSSEAPFLDIGTPDSVRLAEEFVKSNF